MDYNWLEVERNLRQARQNWARLTRVFGREGSDSRTLGMSYVAVVQAVLIKGSETCVISLCIGRALG